MRVLWGGEAVERVDFVDGFWVSRFIILLLGKLQCVKISSVGL